MLPFRTRLTQEQRAREFTRVTTRHPEHVPTILERGDPAAPRLDREKFLLPPNLTVAQLVYVVRRRLRMGSDEALFLVCGKGTVVGGPTTVRELSLRFSDPSDGFLYVRYTLEHAFGGASADGHVLGPTFEAPLALEESCDGRAVHRHSGDVSPRGTTPAPSRGGVLA